MRYVGFDRKFSLLCQESHLAKNSLLSGFDLLLKANFYQEKDGFFYSAFFNISLGMERLLKLGIITHHMLLNDYAAPSVKQLKNEFGHDISLAYRQCLLLLPTYEISFEHMHAWQGEDSRLIAFLSEYARSSRYFNLNEVCESNLARSPLDDWLDIAYAVYERNTPFRTQEKSAMKLLRNMDDNGPPNGFTYNLDEHGHPLTVYDCLRRQFVIEKSSYLIIWRLIEILRPIYYLLQAMAHKAHEYESGGDRDGTIIPYYEEFFYFLLGRKSTITRRKRWLDTFNR